ncbi:unnamed protein product [Rhizophagus irregularis]|nr:unnamed protein product [Rhizophagus irregularis]
MGESQIHGIKDLYTEEQANIRNFQGHEDYNEGTSNDVIEIITDLEDVLADATTSDNAKVIPTNGGKKQKLMLQMIWKKLIQKPYWGRLFYKG